MATTRDSARDFPPEEMMEFASFPKGTERYIRRSLDIGLSRRDVNW